MKSKIVAMPEVAANRKTVEAMLKHLLEAFDAFVDQQPDDSLTYSDVLMGVHNFHAAVIVDMVDRSEGPTELFNAAVGTFAQRMTQEKKKRSMGTGKALN